MPNFAPPGPPRDRTITIRLTESEVKYIDRLAATHGLTRAQCVREVFAGRLSIDDRPAPDGPTTDVAL